MQSKEKVSAAAFSPDGRHLATSVRVQGGTSEDRLVRIWDWRRHEVVQEIETGPGEIAFDRSGARIVTFDGEVAETFDVHTGARIMKEFVGRTQPIWDIAISPDGSRVATAYQTDSIVVLDAGTGEQVLLPQGGMAVSFSPDGRKLASVGGRLVGDSVRIWALDIDDLLEIAQREVTRELTDEECRQFLHLERCPAT